MNCSSVTPPRFGPVRCASRRPISAMPLDLHPARAPNRLPQDLVLRMAERDLRQLLWHRHKLICSRMQLRNQLHSLARSADSSAARSGGGPLPVAGPNSRPCPPTSNPLVSRRRTELLQLLDQLEPSINELDRAVLTQAQQRDDALRLMTHPGIGPVNALAFVRSSAPLRASPQQKAGQLSGTLFQRALHRRETAPRGHQQTGQYHYALAVGEAAKQPYVLIPNFRDYFRIKSRQGSAIARMAISKLAVRMYWMLRSQPITRSWFARKLARGAPW